MGIFDMPKADKINEIIVEIRIYENNLKAS